MKQIESNRKKQRERDRERERERGRNGGREREEKKTYLENVISFPAIIVYIGDIKVVR
jgi:hypothetical protein